MTHELPYTVQGLRARHAEALGVLRRAEWTAYLQGAIILMLAVGLIVSGSNVLYALLSGVAALLLAGLGYLVGRRHSAAAAAALVVLVLGAAIAQVIIGGRRPALLFVGIFAWIYGKAFSAAREYNELDSVLLDTQSGAG